MTVSRKLSMSVSVFLFHLTSRHDFKLLALRSINVSVVCLTASYLVCNANPKCCVMFMSFFNRLIPMCIRSFKND